MIPRMENRLKKKMDNEMETGCNIVVCAGIRGSHSRYVLALLVNLGSALVRCDRNYISNSLLCLKKMTDRCNMDPAPISSGLVLKFRWTIQICVGVIGPGDGVVGSPEKLGRTSRPTELAASLDKAVSSTVYHNHCVRNMKNSMAIARITN